MKKNFTLIILLLCITSFAQDKKLLANNEKPKKEVKAYGRCSGDDGCTACKNCKYCKNCSKDGGTCGVCAAPKKKSRKRS